jgi:biopolymer transport protein ExbD
MQVTEDKPYDEINITPMLDLAYVLLVIFILMTTATVQGLKASLPRATNAPPKPKTKEPPILKSISLDAQGRAFLDNRPVSLQDLEALLKAHKLAHPDFPVVIRGEGTTPYQSVLDVLDIVNRLGVAQRGLATKPRG